MASLKDKPPITNAIRVLKQHRVTYSEHFYDYVEKGGTEEISRQLGFDEHRVIKTLIFQDDRGKPFVILMHGDRSVSVKNLARQLGVKSVQACTQEFAEHNSGYHCGGTSPFGTRRVMPVYIERSILELDTLYINGGHRGYVLQMAPSELVRVLHPTPVDVANDKAGF